MKAQFNAAFFTDLSLLRSKVALPTDFVAPVTLRWLRTITAYRQHNVSKRPLYPSWFVFSLPIEMIELRPCIKQAKELDEWESVGGFDCIDPEQLEYLIDNGEKADTYAAGMLTYFLVSGCNPFMSTDSPEERIARMLLGWKPYAALQHLPPLWADFIETATSLDPEDRFPSARAMEIQLSKLTHG